jgi:hypothetical protein
MEIVFPQECSFPYPGALNWSYSHLNAVERLSYSANTIFVGEGGVLDRRELIPS